MRKFRITIEGEAYEVEVEEIGEEQPGPAASATPPPVKAAPPPPSPPPVAERQPPARVTVDEGVVSAPMPGTVVAINVNVGDAVEAGTVLLTLESMKIKTDISAPKAGRVKEIHVTQGKYVRTREALVSIE